MMKGKPYRIIEKKNLWFTVSLVIILVGFIHMFIKGLNHEPILNYGIDFTGGNTLMITSETLSEKVESLAGDSNAVKEARVSFIEGLQGTLNSFGLEKSSVQVSQDNEVIIKTSILDNQTSTRLQETLKETIGVYEILEIDFIGPAIGSELREKSLWIIFVLFFVLLFYISWRFEFNFGLSAIIAIVHDACITISLASLLNIEINTAFIAALLTVLGYSINDTIVVFDRIRENLHEVKNGLTIQQISNLSIYQTLVRSINTSLTTIFVVGSLLLFGGTSIKEFSLVLCIGILAGTYSSIFIASPVLSMVYKPIEE